VPLPPSRPYAPGSQRVPAPPSSGRRSRLAVVALVLAVINAALLGLFALMYRHAEKNILLLEMLFGLINGLVAILLGGIAIGSIRHHRHKGNAQALTGLLVGLASMITWVVLSAWVLGGQPASQLMNFRADPSALEGLDPPINRAMRANVLIETRHSKLGRLGSGMMGSGVILALPGGDALILTNRHVVDPAFSGEGNPEPKVGDVEVLLLGTGPQTGRVVWVAPEGIDAALVRVPCTTAKAMTARWRRGHRPRVGEQLFAIGNPQALGWTYTQGVVSQHRFQELGGRQVSIIQTQTAINPGNSGGGLYDKEGFLVGINTWTSDRRASEGLNFAISIESLADLFPAELDLRPDGGKP
jgi:S1-C subfamily serine protease